MKRDVWGFCRRWGPTVLVVLWSVFIWHFSFDTAVVSDATSDGVLDACNAFLKEIGVDVTISSRWIRKFAHFAEFGVLGLLSSWAFLAQRYRLFFAWGMAVSVLVAVVDESIQLFSAGRGPSVWDVLLDSAGSACGIAAFCLLLAFLAYVRKNKGKNREKSA